MANDWAASHKVQQTFSAIVYLQVVGQC